MKNLLLSDGDMIQVEYKNLEAGKYVKFQPQSIDFLELPNPKGLYISLFSILLLFLSVNYINITNYLDLNMRFMVFQLLLKEMSFQSTITKKYVI